MVAEWFSDGTTLTEGTDPFYAAVTDVTLPSIIQTTAVTPYDYTDMSTSNPYPPALSQCQFASAISQTSMSTYGGYWNTDKTMTCADIIQQNEMYAEWLQNYQTAKDTFTADQALYNAARQDENERILDFWAQIFDPVTDIPSRPSIPWEPEPFAGVTISWTTPSVTTYNNVVFATPSTRASMHSD